MTLHNRDYQQTFNEVSDLVEQQNTGAFDLARGLNVLYIDYRDEWKQAGGFARENPSIEQFLANMRKQGMNIDPADDNALKLRMKVEYAFRPLIEVHPTVKDIISSRQWVKADKAIGFIAAGFINEANVLEVMQKLSAVPTTQAHRFLRDLFGADYKSEDEQADEVINDDWRKKKLPVQKALSQIENSEDGLLSVSDERTVFVPREVSQGVATERLYADLYRDIMDAEGFETRDELFGLMVRTFVQHYGLKNHRQIMTDLQRDWERAQRRGEGLAYPLPTGTRFARERAPEAVEA